MIFAYLCLPILFRGQIISIARYFITKTKSSQKLTVASCFSLSRFKNSHDHTKTVMTIPKSTKLGKHITSSLPKLLKLLTKLYYIRFAHRQHNCSKISQPRESQRLRIQLIHKWKVKSTLTRSRCTTNLKKNTSTQHYTAPKKLLIKLI